jgi:large subunit ribosomal protein L22
MDQVRGMRAREAMQALDYMRNKAAGILSKLIKSAAANAAENHSLSEGDLVITGGWVDEGRPYKRIRARAQGRANRILKRTSHITVIVEDIPEPERAGRTRPKAKAEEQKTTAAAAGKKKVEKAPEKAQPETQEEAAPVATEATAAEAEAAETAAEPEEKEE